MPFINSTLALNTTLGADSDDRTFTLLEPLRYYSQRYDMTLEMIKGSTTDGLSAPDAVQSFLSRDGKWMWPAIIHDGLYRSTVVKVNPDGSRSLTGLTKPDFDLILRDALIESGCPQIEAETIYEAVSKLGMSSFEGDEKLPIP